MVSDCRSPRHATVPVGHRPVCEPLIEIARQEPDQRWMDPRIGVEAVREQQPVTMANRRIRRSEGRFAGARHRIDASVPQAVHRRSLRADAIVELAQLRRQRSNAGRDIGAESGQGLGFVEDPRQLVAGRLRNPVQHDGAQHGIEAGAIAAAGQDSDAPNRVHGDDRLHREYSALVTWHGRAPM